MRCFLFMAITIIAAHIQLSAQAPQGINYQAVAYDNLGAAVTNHAVGVRLSVLDGGASGPVVYEETQMPSTDNTGLFSIVIGNGSVMSGTFANINWGNGAKWLKTEIDIAGGTNYVTMGSSQFMSVPYAFYAGKTGFSSGSFNIPDGFNNVSTVPLASGINYTVPAGKNLYIPGAAGETIINGDTSEIFLGVEGADLRYFIGAGPGSVVSVYTPNLCFLVDKKVEWKTINLGNLPLTVPAGKQFVIVNSLNRPDDNNCRVSLNGNVLPYGINLTRSILDENATITVSGCAGNAYPSIIINGYFMEKN